VRIVATNLGYYILDSSTIQQEGTFTCSLTNTGTTTYDYNTNTCSYKRIGNVIYFNVNFSWRVNNGVAPNGNDTEIVLGSLPKPVSNRNCYSLGGFFTGGAGGLPPLDTNYSNYNQFTIKQNSNENVKIYVFKSNGTGASYNTIKYNQWGLTALAGEQLIEFSGFYFV
jgi:hypothetical protein